MRWTELEATGGRKKFQREDGKKIDVTPIRFVGACQKGHLQDIEWKMARASRREVQRTDVDRGGGYECRPCKHPNWLPVRTARTVARRRIQAGVSWNLQGSAALVDLAEEGCSENLHFLSRSATNTYFAQTVTLISLPIHEDALSGAIRASIGRASKGQLTPTSWQF